MEIEDVIEVIAMAEKGDAQAVHDAVNRLRENANDRIYHTVETCADAEKLLPIVQNLIMAEKYINMAVYCNGHPVSMYIADKLYRQMVHCLHLMETIAEESNHGKIIR